MCIYKVFSRTAVPQVPASPIFSLQVDPLPSDPNSLVNNPIMIMFDVVGCDYSNGCCVYTCV